MNQQDILFVVQVLSLIFLIIYVVKTWEMASATRRASEATEKSVNEMREARDSETAPYVVVYFDVPENRQLYLIIKNTGKSMAKNIKINFDPPIQTLHPELLTRVISSEGIPSLAPNCEIQTVIDSFRTYKETGPMTYKIQVTYYGGIDEKQRSASYIADLTIHRGIVTSNENIPTIGDIVQELKRLNGSHKELIAAIHSKRKVVSKRKFRY